LTPGIAEFLSLDEIERAAVFDATAERIGTPPSNVEKDFWVCVVLDALFNGRPGTAHRVVFKGGTSLSKVYDAISRFSEDVDIVVMREDLGFEGDEDPANRHGPLRGKPLDRAIKELRAECTAYVHGELREHVAAALATLPVMAEVDIDDENPAEPILLVRYPCVTDGGAGYNPQMVKIEAGARSAVLPDVLASVTPYISAEVEIDLEVHGIRAVAAQRTLLEKLVILHGTSCRDRDQGHVLDDRNRLSRHYYDVARLSEIPEIAAAVHDRDLLVDVVEHSKRTFGNGWRKLDEAVPGTFNIAPSDRLIDQLSTDYDRMTGMMFGEPPAFEWVVERVNLLADELNGTATP